MDDTRIFRWYPPSRVEGEERVTPGFWVPIITIHEEKMVPLVFAAVQSGDPACIHRVSEKHPEDKPNEAIMVIPKEYRASQEEG